MKARKINNIRGSAMIEYVLIIGLIGALSIGQLTSFGSNVSVFFADLSNTLNATSSAIK